ncbi:flagellar M-ring protein FliF [Chromohalobacter canadensis]|uniref:flagellar basal-body MS-ring/collar protein FliF n=1 Tax=Chromohalobacter canadensis TaxID=141389 RepID=UPI0021C1AD33|nr:flagellar basal-body MS-ring/collar protein FliF [Chromohalobacter canadensis]MCT8469779.1 flagellar M-ring protein FliF [Chromohalobacter canadensis]MCT8472386.1 flagellar M-ring protein FliF [Chromohalobacter canadensis]MCT8499501.1 flagellar M-ring protein FliF [Chromohalobacter canadensis]
MSTAASSSTEANQGTSGQRQGNAAAGAGNPPSFVDRMRGNPRVPLIIAAAASVAVIAALLMWASSPDYRVLYSTLTQEDGGKIVTELDSMGVPYEFSENGQALLVPADRVNKLRMQLAEQGLPEASGVGYELMDEQSFGISQFAEHVNYQRALEGELSRTIEDLGPVSNARVHLAMAKPSVFVRESEPASASVMLDLQRGRVLGEGQVQAIMHLVSSSVSELATDDISVVDQTGRLLSPASDGNEALSGTQLDYVSRVERNYAERIESILAPILGARNVKAEVSAQLDFSKREGTSETYSPNQPPNEAAVRSEQSSITYSGDADLAMGIPGALSNQPPGAAASPINAPQEDEDGEGEDAQDDNAQGEDGEDAAAQENAALGRTSRDNTINYEVDHQVEHVQHQTGTVERLNAAIVVNYRDGVDEDGNPARVPLSDDEIASIRSLVQQAMGFSEARGDQLEVVNSPFDETDEQAPESPWWKSTLLWSLAATLGKYLLIGLVALFLWFKVLRPLIQRQTERPAFTPATPSPAGATAGAGAGGGADAYATTQAETAGTEEEPPAPPQKRRERRSASYEQNLRDVREIAQEDPRLVAMIVRGWMDSHE